LVRSVLVVPFWLVAPTARNGSKNSPGWFSLDWNIRCSNRWAKPLRPAGSSLLPTWYQMLTATIGALRSVCTTTRRPLGRTKLSWAMSTTGASAAAAAGSETRPVPSARPRAVVSRARRSGRRNGAVNDMQDPCNT
jgi:hypothetical protein